MTEAQYRVLAESCDTLLRHPHADVAWLATPALHVVSEHPVHLMQYADLGRLLRWEVPASRRFSQARSRPYRLASLARRHVAAHLSGSSPDDAVDTGGRAPVIIVSWLVHASHLSRDEDFYVGTIQQALAARGTDSLLVLRNATGEPAGRLREAARRPFPCARLLLPDVATPAEERRLTRVQGAVRRGLAAAAAAGDLPPMAATVARFVRRALPSSLASENLLLQAQVEALCRRFRPPLVITLYEGHAWERCVWAAARRAHPAVACAGYQHTILRRHAHAVTRLVGGGKGWDPDLVLALGDETARRLRTAPGMAGTPVIVLGSHRAVAPSARGPVECRRSVLVAPEGLEDECLRLFSFALRCAGVLPDMRFVFWTHPVFPYARIAARLPGGGRLPPNVEISTAASVEDEFRRSDLCLYRGSSVALYAVLAGLRPVYAATPGEMTIDPLHDLDGWRLTAGTPEQFVAGVRRAAAMAPEAQWQQWSRAADHCARYAQPFRAAALDEMLGMTAVDAAAAQD